jgi:radical SAM superfamily enzyme YgiQ (UPF0313 family)
MKTVLLSCYEMGRQPFGLASPAAWLRSGGHAVSCIDLSIEQLSPQLIEQAGLVCFYLPMHTATRLALPLIERVREINRGAHLCGYGLYAPLNATYLREKGVDTILGGEFEAALLSLADTLDSARAPASRESSIGLDRLRFLTPHRSLLPPPSSYAKLRHGADVRLAGYTEASRGCKHLCRHCPVVPVYNGAFRVVQPDVVLADIRQQVEAGVEHISFGDPDFLNGPAHARRIVEALHRDHPNLTYDATIKIEHLRRHSDFASLLKDTGCLFVTSAVESLDDGVLAKLQKGHTRDDFYRVVELFRKLDLTLAPTFIAFTPWTTLATYREFLAALRELDLIRNVSSIQLALRLLIPAGSRMLELPEIRSVVTDFDPPALLHRWQHAAPAIDRLAEDALKIAGRKGSRPQLFAQIWERAHGAPLYEPLDLLPRAAIPYMDEPWYC